MNVMDQDRYCGPVEVGHTTITLKDAKQTVADPEKFATTQFIKQTTKVNQDAKLCLNIESSVTFSFTFMTESYSQLLHCEGSTYNSRPVESCFLA